MTGLHNTAFSKTARFYCLVAILTFVMGLVPVVFNLIVDPYELAELVDTGLEKKKISEKAHYPLWKVIHYPEKTSDIVVLGDSRARSLRDKYWRNLGVSSAYNFAYGGATLYEIYDTFKYVKSKSNLKTLIIGIQLRSFNPSHKNGLNRVPEAIKLGHKPLKYYSNWFVSRIGLKLLQKEFGPRFLWLADLTASPIASAYAEELSKTEQNPLRKLLDPEVCDSCMLPENIAPATHRSFAIAHGYHFANDLGIWKGLWSRTALDRVLTGKYKKQVFRNGKADWRSFKFSEKFWMYLVEISTWSKQNNVQLIFVIPPTIVEMQYRIFDSGYGELNHDFRRRLLKLGLVVDFDFDSPLTRDLGRFTDAYHFNNKAAKLIVGEITQLVSTDKMIVAKARKRRKDIICPVFKKDISNRTTDDFMEVLEGKSCRFWKVRSG